MKILRTVIMWDEEDLKNAWRAYTGKVPPEMLIKKS